MWNAKIRHRPLGAVRSVELLVLLTVVMVVGIVGFPALMAAVTAELADLGIVMESLDHAREDFDARNLAEARVELGRVVLAVRTTLAEVGHVSGLLDAQGEILTGLSTAQVDELIAGTGSQVVAKLYGADFDVLQAQRDRIEELGITVVTATDGNHGRALAWAKLDTDITSAPALVRCGIRPRSIPATTGPNAATGTARPTTSTLRPWNSCFLND